MGMILLQSTRSVAPRWSRSAGVVIDSVEEDITPPEDEVPTSWWAIGLSCSTILSSAILAMMFDFTIFQALFSLVLGFLFSFIGVQSCGQTDVNPVGTVAKVCFLLLAGSGVLMLSYAGIPSYIRRTHKAVWFRSVKSGDSEPHGRGHCSWFFGSSMCALTSAFSLANFVIQATDMVGDLKTGYLLRAKPRSQFVAQLAGSFVAVFLNVGLFILFTKSSPCIITGEQPCAYGAPSVGTSRLVLKATLIDAAL